MHAEIGNTPKRSSPNWRLSKAYDSNCESKITARAPGGFDEAKIRTVRENATVLKFSDSGFEPS
ncbi:hypothetical protein GCM10009609_43740 [Pseudonocardia aurantiaca]